VTNGRSEYLNLALRPDGERDQVVWNNNWERGKTLHTNEAVDCAHKSGAMTFINWDRNKM
jgi:hypothetical protein